MKFLKGVAILVFPLLSLGLAAKETQIEREMRSIWESAIKKQMKPGAEAFIKAVKGRNYAWVEKQIQQGADPNDYFYGNYSITKIIFPINEAILAGDIKMFDILAPVSNYDCVTINYALGATVEKSKDCRDILFSLLISSIGDKWGQKLLKHAIENYPRVRASLDRPALGYSLRDKSAREYWQLTTESFCTNPTSSEERKTCAEWKAVWDIISDYPPEAQAPVTEEKAESPDSNK